MERRSKHQLLIWLLGCIALAGWLWHSHEQREPLMLYNTEVTHAFPGTDWVQWENKGDLIVATDVHPLQRYKPFPAKKIQRGDRLRKINYIEILSAEAAEDLADASPQGKTFIFQITPKESLSDSTYEIRRVQTGFILPYMASSHGSWWRIQAWLAGLLLVVSLMVALILFPIIKVRPKTYLSLLLVVSMSLLLSSWQSLHALYLVLESDLMWTGMAKAGMVFLSIIIPGYGIAFIWSKKNIPTWMRAPYVLVLCILCYWAFSWAKAPIHPREMIWLMQTVMGSFWLLLAIASSLDLIVEHDWKSIVSWLKAIAIIIFLLLLTSLWLKAPGAIEFNILALHILMFAPLLDAAQNELRFGKVSLVVTRALQAVAFLAFSMLVYFLISSLYGALLPDNPYRSILEVISLLLALLTGRWLYRANQRRFNAYFTTTQQERLDTFREFLASIPRYTSAETLKEDVLTKTSDFFHTDTRWWNAEEAEEWEPDFREVLTEKRSFWAQSPELGGLQPSQDLEEQLSQWPHALALPLAAEDKDAAMLLLQRKRRGVYNLADLDLLFQLARQTHLTLNVLALMGRERELMERNFEANLTVLRAQINPHFLFNTLNTISALIHDAPDLAEEAVEHLAFIFRYTLDHSGDSFVQLKQELSLVSTYLEIEKIRFGDRIMVSIDAEREAQDTLIPALVIQTLIENCIKHGIAKIIGKGIVSIDMYVEDEITVVEVYDNGPGIDLDRINKGTGLQNVLTRLSHIYQTKNSLYFENTGDGTRAILRIPKRPPPQQSSFVSPNINMT